MFRKPDENVYDTLILESIKETAINKSLQVMYQLMTYLDILFLSLNFLIQHLATKTVIATNINTTSPETQQVMDSPFGIPLHAGCSVPSFDLACSIEEPVKVKPSGKNPFTKTI